MPHKDTPALPLVSNYPWLYQNTDPIPYVQEKLYRGTGNNKGMVLNNPIFYENVEQTNDDFASTGASNSHIDGDWLHQNTQCRIPTNDCPAGSPPTDPRSDPNYPYWVRMMMDSCTNQYILPMGLNPRYLLSPVFRADGASWNENYCQHLFLSPVKCKADLVNDHTGKTCLSDTGENADASGDNNMYDYRAWGYLERAWLDVVYTPYSPASTDPNTLLVGSGVGHITVPATVPADTDYKKYGDPLDYNKPGNADNPTDKFTGNLTTINELASRPYERIYDSTHPFSPRWDMTGRLDRDLSSEALISGVYKGYSVVPSPCLVRCAAVPVDILTFRADEFNDCMTCRIDVNTKCLWDEVLVNNLVLNLDLYQNNPLNALKDALAGTSPYVGFKISAKIAFFTITLYENDHAFDYRCKSALQQLGPTQYNPWSVSGEWPPCSTTYDYPFDNHPNDLPYQTTWIYSGPGTCGGCLAKANDYADNATGTADSTNKTSTKSYRLSGVTKCCNDLAQPVAPINTLRIRNIQDDPALKDKDGTGNVAEGYKFSDYFPSGHMPYMRWWDTGTSAGTSATGTWGGASGYPGMPETGWVGAVNLLNDPVLGMNYDPHCDKGQYDAIVGIGTERDDVGGSPSGLCRYGGGGDDNTYQCISVNNPDRLTSWYELKQAQMSAMRDYGLHCLPMHEKLRKWQEGEDGALFQAGRHFDALTPEINDDPAAGGTGSLYERVPRPWPLRWRGFLTDSRPGTGSVPYPYRFPNFLTDAGGIPAGALMTGLDNAKAGDIIYVLPTDDAATTGHIMPFVAVVSGLPHHDGKCTDNIQVTDVNNGKYPDVCGDTDYRGMGQTRTIYKEWLPKDVLDILFAGSGGSLVTNSCGDSYTVPPGTSLIANANGNCMDPRYSKCTFADLPGSTSPGYWNDIHVYRPSLDERTSPGSSR